ncbi:MAG: hypothetical protein C5B59_03220 [Bacteroidetes bacterium]|nr:MAG: hypothetical protein C5B59_03220 [Bacteroidota bacterium]
MALSIFGFCALSTQLAKAQNSLEINIHAVEGEKVIAVEVQGKAFTNLFYPDSLAKPVLFPIHAPNGGLITRGFPLDTRPEDATDHPHHIGLWFNYENVNGLDFWNNSYAIPEEKKSSYGWIKVDSIQDIKSGKLAWIKWSANWQNQKGDKLLRENTIYFFSANQAWRIIDRVTVLTAVQDVSFDDSKDGLLGLRVAHELELPSAQPKQYFDNKGNSTTVQANSSNATGNYLTSEGRQGDSAWGTRAKWCLLYGKKNKDSISILIIDHPSNPGFPTYWHARGYGLFAANPLGQKIFSNGKESLNFKLNKGQSVTFRYRVVVASGKNRLTPNQIDFLAKEFSNK